MPIVNMQSYPFSTAPAYPYSLASTTYPLDLVSGASGAWSLRQLAVGYAGNCCKIRRSSDNTTQDIPFLDNKYCDFATLTTFLAGSNGFVDTIYDQSGNSRHLVQATTGNQPQIAASGAYYTSIGGYPGIDFPNSGTVFLDTTGFNVSTMMSTTAGTVFSIWYADSDQTVAEPGGRGIWAHKGGNEGLMLGTSAALRGYLYSGGYITSKTTLALSTSYVTCWQHGSSVQYIFANSNTAADSDSAGTSDPLTLPLGIGHLASGISGSYFDGRQVEHIIYPTMLNSTDRGTIGAAMAVPFGLTWS